MTSQVHCSILRKALQLQLVAADLIDESNKLDPYSIEKVELLVHIERLNSVAKDLLNKFNNCRPIPQ